MRSKTLSSDGASPRRMHEGDGRGGIGNATVLVLEGMPGAGKSTLAAKLSRSGHLVVPEYAAAEGSVVRHDDHPAVDHDDAHQRNWLRKHHLTEVLSAASRGADWWGVVWVDRDWLSALAYAYSLDDRALLSARVEWATSHLATAQLKVASAYLVLQVDPAESLRRRSDRLDQAHPWSQPAR